MEIIYNILTWIFLISVLMCACADADTHKGNTKIYRDLQETTRNRKSEV